MLSGCDMTELSLNAWIQMFLIKWTVVHLQSNLYGCETMSVSTVPRKFDIVRELRIETVQEHSVYD